ncbi:MAG: hypothetical protein ABSE51_16940 [Terracidiphilus sp.]
MLLFLATLCVGMTACVDFKARSSAGTTPGIYTVTVVGVSANITATSAFTLTKQ